VSGSAGTIERAVSEPALLGESPVWHPDEQALYYTDIPGCELRRFDPATGELQRWTFDTDVGCCAPVMGGGLLLALRSGFWHFDPATQARRRLEPPPYDPAQERFNDGKADAAGRMWCGTIYEPRQPALAALYCLEDGELTRKADGVTVSNGLAWSPDGRTMYWSDTSAHTIYALDFAVRTGEISNRRVFARFAPRGPGQPLDAYGGRPDGAAVDAEGGLWVAMFEGRRVLRLRPDGSVDRELMLPVRCPTMPCFGGPDLQTLYITTARHKRSDFELAQQPWAGSVLSLRVDVPGLPANFAQLG
jgi:sugar lactone lactonase YvrE